MHIHIYIYICMYISIHIYMSISLSLYIYIYLVIYIYIYIYTYICIYVCICIPIIGGASGESQFRWARLVESGETTGTAEPSLSREQTRGPGAGSGKDKCYILLLEINIY